MAGSKLDLLLKWFEENKFEWDKESLEIRETGNGFGVFATKNLKKENTLVKIPKECVLSTQTTGIANILEEEQLEGGCALALAVLYELAIGEDSPWYPYLQTLPEEGEDLPLFWEDEEQELLAGTEVYKSTRNDMNDLIDDYEEIIEPILEEHPYIFVRNMEREDPYSFERFIKISTVISSRAFEVDSFHENALVPFADIFNHRIEDEQVHFQTEYDVCDACGAPDYCEHRYLESLEQEELAQKIENDDQEGDEDEEDDEEWEDEDILEEELETELPDLEALEIAGVNFWDAEEEEEPVDSCDMVLGRNVKKGEEIFNTYGDLPNGTLLSKYGFCQDNNKNDYITITEDSVVDCCLAITAEILKADNPDLDPKELEKLALAQTKPRWEFFLKNEQTLCPTEDDDELDGMHDDYDEGCQDSCCGSEDGHDHGNHSHDNDKDEHDHEHDEDGGCCGGEDDEASSRPYFVNSEGLFEDKLMCLLHIMFVPKDKFEKFTEDIENAEKYFDEIAKSQGENKNKEMVLVKLNIYQVSRALCEFRRLAYFEEDGEWRPIDKDIEEREKVASNKRAYFALTCRIGEKKIIEKAVDYYGSLVDEYTAEAKKNKK
ncbi:SET domain-containing protein [Backusella circina FSU 941]|nr:SET domain-containing protein [Backusella circina FSU 941]